MSEERLPNIASVAVEREETCRLGSHIWPRAVSCRAISIASSRRLLLV